jgi:hypothetical protein
MTAHDVPRTAVPLVGWVIATRSAPLDGAGVLAVFDTVTDRVVVAEPPSVSVTRSDSV